MAMLEFRSWVPSAPERYVQGLSERFAGQELFSDAHKDAFARTHPVATDRLARLRQLVESSPYYNAKDSPELQQRHDLSYLFISHDLKVVRALANDVIVMRDGKVVEAGTADEVFDRPRSDYTRALLAAAFSLQVAHAAAV